METVSNITQFLKERSFFQEVLLLGVGVFFLLLADIILYPNLNQIPNYGNLTTTFEILFVIVVSYFVSRICRDIGMIAAEIVLFIFCKKDKLGEISKKLGNFIDVTGSQKYKPTKEEVGTHSTLEAVEHFKESTYLRFIYDEAAIQSMLGDSFLGFSILLTFIAFFTPHLFEIKYYFAFIIICIAYACFKNYRLMKTGRRLVAIYERIHDHKNIPEA